MCGLFEVLGIYTIYNLLTSLSLLDFDYRTMVSTGWRPKVADVDVNNHPVPGCLSPCADWCSILRCSHDLLGQEDGMEQRNHQCYTQCWAGWSGWNRVPLVLINKCVLLQGLQRNMFTHGNSEVSVMTWQLVWLMMALLLRPCWTTKMFLHVWQACARQMLISIVEEPGWPFA